jgi:hypothetical protein
VRPPEEPERRWRAARPIHLPGALDLATWRAEIRRTRGWFERLREGASFEHGFFARLAEGARFRRVGVSVDLGDTREIEKAHVDLASGRGALARDLYAKLSWISTDEGDDSLRIRFSFGSERLLDWTRDSKRATAADLLAQAVFPECAALTEERTLRRRIDTLAGRATRLSERIVYSNAPGGGAVFHHDAESSQLGVVYGQLSGQTGWLALPKQELAEEICELAREGRLAGIAGTPRRALDSLEGSHPPGFERLLNRSTRLTRRLVEHGHFYCLRAGDVLILPSPSKGAVCWHSVFSLGGAASLSHSYGIFRR